MSTINVKAPLPVSATSKKSKRHQKKRQGPKSRVCLEVVIIRHAETDLNAQSTRVLQGQLDTEINVFGEKQAIKVSDRLRHEKFDCIYTSDLKRAVQTTNIIAKNHSSKPVVKDQRLREQDLGDLTGKTWKEAKSILKKEDRHLEDHVRVRGGEGNEVFNRRINDFYSSLIETHLVTPHRETVERLEKQLSCKSQRPSLMRLSRAGSQMSNRMSVDDREKGGVPMVVDEKLKVDTVSRPKMVQSPLLRTPSSASSPCPHPSLSPMRMTARSPASICSFDDVETAALSMIACSKLKKQKILIVTHGGWIKHFMGYLISDLEFKVNEHSHGFPRNTGIYKFIISWAPNEAFDDFEWRGVIKHMNSLGHMARISKMVHPDVIDLEKAKKKYEAIAKFKAQRSGKAKKIDPYQEIIESLSIKSSPSHSPQLVRKALYEASIKDPEKLKRSLGW